MAVPSLELEDVWFTYQQMFGEKPPIFGYEDKDVFPAIIKAIKTKTPIVPMNELIEKDLAISDEDIDEGRGIIT